MATKKSSSSDAEYDFATVTGSSADIEDDFDWADDELPAGATPAAFAASQAAAPAQPAPAAVKQGPIPFAKAPAATTSTPAAQRQAAPAAKPSAAAAAAAAAAAGASPAAAATAAPRQGGAAGPAAKPQGPGPRPVGGQPGPKPPLVRPPGLPPSANAPAAAAAAGVSPAATTTAQPAAATGGKPVASPAQRPTPAGTAAAQQPAAGQTTAGTAAAASSRTAMPLPGAMAQAAPAAPAAGAAPAGKAPGSTAVGSASSEISPAAGTEVGQPAVAAGVEGASSSTGGGPGSNNSSGGGSAKGWGGWLAPASLGGLSSKLQQVALGAAKDLQEFTASVQQVVAEVVAADDITEVDRLAEYQAHPVRPQEGPGAAGPGAGPPAPVMASRDSSSQLGPGSRAHGGGSVGAGAAGSSPAAAAEGSWSGDLDPEEAKRREVLQKLQGKDTQLESGLKVIDDQVDALAANAVKALGSLWGGINTVAKTSWGLTAAITNKVEAAAKEMAKEVAVGLEEGASLVARAEKGLESVLGPRVTSGGGSQRSAAEWEATFESCYELFGGTTATDELDELSSECAHICNIARANLQHQRDEIDAMLTKLVPLFDPTALLQQQEGADAAAAAAVPGVDEGMHDALDALYAPVIALCKKGKRNASQLQLGASEAVAAAAAEVAADAAASPKGHQQQQQRSQDGEAEADRQAAGSSEVQQQVDVHDPQLLEQQRVCVVLQEVLQSVRSAAVKSLAEVAAGQIMVLLTMARSIGAVPRYGKPLADGLEWPSDAEVVGALMRSQLQQMVTDTREVAAAFAAAAAQVATHMPPAASTPSPAAAAAVGTVGDGSSSDGAREGPAVAQVSPQEVLQLRAAAAASEVDADCQMVLAHVRDSHGKLLYVVLLASLHRAGKEESVQPQGQEQQQAAAAAAEPQEQQQQQLNRPQESDLL